MTDQNKWSIFISGGNNINNHGNNFRNNSMGGIINAGFQKTCLICQEIVGLEFSNECQCEKKNSHCKYCQSSDIDKKNCSCQKEKQLSELEAKIVQSKKGETELEESFEKQRLGLESVRKKAIKSRKGEKNNDRLQIERNNLQQMKGFRQRTLTNGTSNEQIKPNLKYLIDRGGYGEVYYGEWKLQEVAVKKLYLPIHIASESDIKVIKKEIEILKDLRNRYIIQYYGVYSDDQGFLIIMDYAENGTLTKFVNDNKNKEHDWNFNTNLIKQMALGLAYIHHENFIHRDLKSMNILLANNYEVKISDFGLSKTKTMSSSSQSKDVKGTLRWMAPELLRGEKYSEQTDIHSLGMVIWEIAAKCTRPFEDIDDNSVGIYIARNKKEIIPSDTPRDIQNIIEQCWENDPSKRITLLSILEIIKSDSYASRLLESSNLSKSRNGQEINDHFRKFSQSLKFDIGEINKFLEERREQLTLTDWTTAHSSFAPQLIQQWQSHNFTAQQCKEWINIGLKYTEYIFCAWLRDTKQLTPEEVLNHGNLEQLNQEYFQWWQSQQQTQIQIPPK